MLTTHVLDTASGTPAANLKIVLHDAAGAVVSTALTNGDGRTDAPLLGAPEAGTYEIHFHLGDYFAANGVASPFLDVVPVRFTITEPGAHYHVPLLASPFSYSTYRGS